MADESSGGFKVFQPLQKDLFSLEVLVRFHALDPKNGSERWGGNTEGPMRGAPLYVDGRFITSRIMGTSIQ